MDPSECSGILLLPAEVLCLVLAHLDPRSLQQAGGVCRAWRRIVADDRSWRLAFQRTFPRLPLARLAPARMPSGGGGSEGGGGGRQWVDTAAHRRSSWRQELTDRLRLRRAWEQAPRRLEFGARASAIDRLVVSERHGWALAVSVAGAVAVRSLPRTGKVFARDAETKDLVFAHEGGGAHPRVSAVAARADRICWGLADGATAATHLTPGGALRSRVVTAAAATAGAPVLAVAGALDALAAGQRQRLPAWPAVCGVAASAAAASATADGGVYVWCTETGRVARTLQGTGEAVVAVTWAQGARFVVGATRGGAILVWDAAAPGAAPCSVRAAAGGGRGQRVVLLAGDPFSDAFVVATEAGGVRRMAASAHVTETTVAATTAAETEFVADAPGFAAVTAAQWQAAGADGGTRLLLVGDARGSLWAFDADCRQPLARPLAAWPRLHRCAVAAVAANAAVVVSAARDGQVLVLDPLTAQRLHAMPRRSSGAGAADPWFLSVHPAIIDEHTRSSVRLAQLLAARTSAQWDRQIQQDHGDTLDRRANANANNNANANANAGDNDDDNEIPALFALQQADDPRVDRGFPTLVADVHAGYGWVVVASGTRIQSCFVEPPGSSSHHRRHHRQHRPKHRAQHHGLERREVEEDLASMRLETQADRDRRIELHEHRARLERTFIEPEEQLGLDPTEQLEYAIWLSSQQQQQQQQQVSDDMTEDEQLQYALLISEAQT